MREGKLGEAVGEIAGPQLRRSRISQEDDHSIGSRPEEGEKRLGEKKRPAQVDSEDPVDIPGMDFSHRGAGKDRRVVDEEVQAAEFPLHRIEEAGNPFWAQQVEEDVPAADFPGEGPGFRARGAVGDRDGEPFAGEPPGDRRADTPGSPGDQRNLFPGKTHFSSMNISFGDPQMGHGSGGSSPWWM